MEIMILEQNGTDLYLLHSIVGSLTIVQFDDKESKSYIERLQRQYFDITACY